MTGPTNEAEARQAMAELICILDRHAFYCGVCLDKGPCPMADVYRKSIAAAEALTEVAKVVDGRDQEA